MNQVLAYSTSTMSWQMIRSSLSLAKSGAEGPIGSFDLNLETPPSLVLCCIAVEAFSNEISSMAAAFIFDKKAEGAYFPGNFADAGISCETCEAIAAIKDDSRGSFYDRFKKLLKETDLAKPARIAKLVHLRDLRDALVHFRTCDIPVVEGEDGVIRYGQESPQVFGHLRNLKVSSFPILAEAPGQEWTLTMSTSALAAWAIGLVLETIQGTLGAIPNGEFKKFVQKQYGVTDPAFSNLFDREMYNIEKWKEEVFH